MSKVKEDKSINTNLEIRLILSKYEAGEIGKLSDYEDQTHLQMSI